jgi:acyl carrier protein
VTEAEIQATLTKLFRETLHAPDLELRPEHGEFDIPGFDSGIKVMLILAVEERFAIRLRNREIEALRRFGDWVALIHRHGSAAGG